MRIGLLQRMQSDTIIQVPVREPWTPNTSCRILYFTSNNGGKNFSIKGNVGQQYNYNEAVKSQYKTYRFFAFDKGEIYR